MFKKFYQLIYFYLIYLYFIDLAVPTYSPTIQLKRKLCSVHKHDNIDHVTRISKVGLIEQFNKDKQSAFKRSNSLL